LWAAALEKRADGWGRQIRYGLPPDDPESWATRGTRAQTIEFLMVLAHLIEIVETGTPRIENQPTRRDDASMSALENLEEGIRSILGDWSKTS
jgi:hypothetical protein